MLIYKDVISEDEMISDSYDLKLVDGVIYEADCANITIGADNIDIGANPSAEDGGDEGTDDTTSTVIDVVHSFRLTQTSYDKKSYVSHLKQYMKRVKESLKERNASEEEIKEFETGAQKFAKKVIGSFDKWDFYVGETMNADAMVVLINYRADEVTPYACFWKHGMKEMKV